MKVTSEIAPSFTPLNITIESKADLFMTASLFGGLTGHIEAAFGFDAGSIYSLLVYEIEKRGLTDEYDAMIGLNISFSNKD